VGESDCISQRTGGTFGHGRVLRAQSHDLIWGRRRTADLGLVDVHVADAGLGGGAAPGLAGGTAAGVLLCVRVDHARDARPAAGAIARRVTRRTCIRTAASQRQAPCYDCTCLAGMRALRSIFGF